MNRLRKAIRRDTREEPRAEVGVGRPGDSENLAEALSGWEGEGGSASDGSESSGTFSKVKDRAVAVATAFAITSRRQGNRLRLEFAIRRLEARVKANIRKLGPEVFPLIESGTPVGEDLSVQQRLATIAALRAELARQQAELGILLEYGNASQTAEASMADIDTNATRATASALSAEDELAEAAEQPPEEGGRG